MERLLFLTMCALTALCCTRQNNSLQVKGKENDINSMNNDSVSICLKEIAIKDKRLNVLIEKVTSDNHVTLPEGDYLIDYVPSSIYDNGFYFIINSFSPYKQLMNTLGFFFEYKGRRFFVSNAFPQCFILTTDRNYNVTLYASDDWNSSTPLVSYHSDDRLILLNIIE